MDAGYVGRVGALAIFLGVGAAIASSPTAFADEPGSAGSASTSSSSAPAVESAAAERSASTPERDDSADDAKLQEAVDLPSDSDGDEGSISERRTAAGGASEAVATAFSEEAEFFEDPEQPTPAAPTVSSVDDDVPEKDLPAPPSVDASPTVPAVEPIAAAAETRTRAARTDEPAGRRRFRLIGDGTAETPNAGILFGDGFSWDASSCTGGVSCHGGRGGLWGGNGGNGFNGGHGGSAGWFGSGGNGGAGVAGRSGGLGGRGGLIYGTGGQAGDDGARAYLAKAGADDAADEVTVGLPPMPVSDGWAFTVSPDFMAGFAADYLAEGGEPADGARFFFGDLAVASLDALAEADITGEQVSLLLGNLAASGYFGGVWLRDNLRDSPRDTETTTPADPATATERAVTPSAIAIGLFDALAAGLTGASAATNSWVVTTAARASVPVLLTLYGYNRGYLEVVLENPPDGVPSMQDSLVCDGFLGCTSSAFPLASSTGYDSVLDHLEEPSSNRWQEMALWTSLLEGATSTGRSVWENIAQSGFSPESYAVLVELSSAYLMVSKAAVLSSMLAYADGDAQVGASSLRLQAGLWIWSGAYFGGLASDAPVGTMPVIRPAGQ